MKIASDREGFALPLAVLVLMISAGAALATMNAASSERRVMDSDRAANHALVLAESGLSQAATQADAWGWGALPDATLDSARVTFTNGYADVVRVRIRPWTVTNSAIYLVRSRGVYTKGGWAGAPAAVRMVTRYGTYSIGTLDARAAWTSITGLLKNGGSGTISGEDACGVLGSVAGVAVPDDPGYDQNGGSSVPAGDPDIESLGADADEAADAININWAGIVDGS
jgi:hypothetical protein